MECCTKARKNQAQAPQNYTIPQNQHKFAVIEAIPTPASPKNLPDHVRANIITKNRSGETIVFSCNELAAYGDSVRTLMNSEFRAENCNECVFLVLEVVKSITIDNCTDCSFILFCSGSIFFRECANLRVSCVCKQLRLRGSSGSVAGLVKTAPVIEKCSEIVVSQFSVACDDEQVLQCCHDEAYKCGVDPSENKIDAMYDFTPSENQNVLNFKVADTFCGASIDESQNRSDCGILGVWSCYFGSVGVNCTEQVAEVIGGFCVSGNPIHVVRACKLSEKARNYYQLEKKKFDFYLIVDADVEEELCQLQRGTEFLILSEEDVDRIKRLEI